MTMPSSLPPPSAMPLPPRPIVEVRPRLWNPEPQNGVGGTSPQRMCDAAMVATAAAFALPVGELNAPTRRSPYAAFARQSAMYLAHVAFGLTYTEIGHGFRRDRTTAAYACRLVEDWRDDPAIDAVLASLESACTGLRGRLKVRS